MNAEVDAREARFRQSEPQQAWHWVRSTCEYAYCVQVTGKEFDPTHAGTLLLRLYSVLVELPKYLATVPGTDRALETIETLRGGLTRDELLWTQYRRDSECHIVVDYYAPLKPGGVVRDAIKAKTVLGAPPIPWAEFDDALGRVLALHHAPGVNPEHGLARSIAVTVENPLQTLLVTMHDPLTREAVRVNRPFMPTWPTRPPGAPPR